MAVASSSLASLSLPIDSIKNTVTRPIRLAPNIRSGLSKSLTRKKAKTMPSRTEWLMASVIMDSFLKIKNIPSSEHDMDVSIKTMSASVI